MVDIGKRFVESTYVFEGDSFLPPWTYSVLYELEISMQQMIDAINMTRDEILAYISNVRAVILIDLWDITNLQII